MRARSREALASRRARTSRMTRLYGYALEKPRLVLCACVLLLAALAPGLLRLRLRTDGLALVARDAPEVAIDRSIRDEFGVADQIVVVVETSGPAGIYDARTLAHVARLSQEIAAIPGVDSEDVLSLATEPGDHVKPGTLEFLKWIEPPPATGAAIAALRTGLERAGVYAGTLISSDSPPSATVIVVSVRDGADREDLHRRVRAAALRDLPDGHRIHVVGAPVVETQLGAHLLDDLALLVPAAFLVMAAFLYASLRNPWVVLLALAGVGACILATLAAMGWCGAPIYLTCLVMPVILTAVGVADSVHIYDQYAHCVRATPGVSPRDALHLALDDVGRAVVNTSVTDAIGFLSFALTSIEALRVFGVFLALGTMLLLVWSLTVFPAGLALLGRRAVPPARATTLRERLAPRFLAWTGAVLARRRTVIAAFAVVALGAGFLATKVVVQDSWVEGFAPDSEIRTATERVDRTFGGTHLLRLRLVGEVARAQGRIARDSFDHLGARLPGILADPPGQLVHHRLIVRPAPGTAPPALDRPIRMMVTGAALEDGGTRLFLQSPELPATSPRDLLPHGVQEFEYVLDAGDRLRTPEMLATIGAFEAFLAGRDALGVGAVLGPWSHLSALNRMVGGDAVKAQAFLETRSGLSHTFQIYARARGDRRLREIYSPSFDRALVTLLVRDASYVRVEKLIAEIRGFEREHLAPLGVTLDIGGDLAVSQSMIGGIVRTQVISLATSILGILAVTFFLTRSLAFGLICAVPCALAVVVDFALLGALSIPLGVATSMFAGMTIGVGVDYAIHAWERLRRSAEAGEDLDLAIARSFSDVGPAILIDGLAVGAGFSVLCFSSVPTNARLGGLLVASILACLVATLVLMPCLLRTAGRAWQRRSAR